MPVFRVRCHTFTLQYLYNHPTTRLFHPREISFMNEPLCRELSSSYSWMRFYFRKSLLLRLLIRMCSISPSSSLATLLCSKRNPKRSDVKLNWKKLIFFLYLHLLAIELRWHCFLKVVVLDIVVVVAFVVDIVVVVVAVLVVVVFFFFRILFAYLKSFSSLFLWSLVKLKKLKSSKSTSD